MPKELDAIAVARAALPVAILAALSHRATHGYALMEVLGRHGFPDLKGGSLYPLLARLESQGLLGSEWNHDQSGPGRKMFAITAQGEAFLTDARMAWRDMSVNLDKLSKTGVGTA